MSDGPFRNTKLSKGWKKFAVAVENGAFDSYECCALASDALVREILVHDVPPLLAKLQAIVLGEQLDLDPLSSVESIFDGYSKAPFSDNLQKEVVFRLSEKSEPSEAIMDALDAAVGGRIRETRSHIEEDCIRAREAGEMRPDQFVRTVNQSNVIFEELSKNEICAALLACNKAAFKDDVSKKKGLDEGPRL